MEIYSPKNILGEIRNKFWSDVVKSIISMNKTFKFNKLIQIQHMPLWHNSQINVEYRKEWGKKDIMTEMIS